MLKRAYNFAGKLGFIASAAISGLAVVDESSARDNKAGAGTTCECFCDAQNNGGEFKQYNAVAACSAYDNKACTIEVFQDGAYLLRTGKLTLCAPKQSTEAVGQSTVTTNSPGKPPKPPKWRPRSTIAKPDSTAPAKPR